MLWCLVIRHAVLTGELAVRTQLSLLPAARAALWLKRIETAERCKPSDFTRAAGWFRPSKGVECHPVGGAVTWWSRPSSDFRAESRTATVAALYGARVAGISAWTRSQTCRASHLTRGQIRCLCRCFEAR